jgi:hypothetical protein
MLSSRAEQARYRYLRDGAHLMRLNCACREGCRCRSSVGTSRHAYVQSRYRDVMEVRAPWWYWCAMWRRLSRSASGRGGHEIVRQQADIDYATRDTLAAVRIYTRTTRAQVVALCEAVRYISATGVGGDIVECGVWRGGSMLAAARTLLESGDCFRTLWLYDTFSAMAEPSDLDGGDAVLAPVSLPAVQRTLSKAGYPDSRIRYVVGRSQETIPMTVPCSIALLRLGADRYEKTRHELEHLVPRMTPGAVLIVDDYGQLQGARRAVDEFIEATRTRLLLHRIDHAARIGVLAAAAAPRRAAMEEHALALR